MDFLYLGLFVFSPTFYYFEEFMIIKIVRFRLIESMLDAGELALAAT